MNFRGREWKTNSTRQQNSPISSGVNATAEHPYTGWKKMADISSTNRQFFHHPTGRRRRRRRPGRFHPRARAVHPLGCVTNSDLLAGARGFS